MTPPLSIIALPTQGYISGFYATVLKNCIAILLPDKNTINVIRGIVALKYFYIATLPLSLSLKIIAISSYANLMHLSDHHHLIPPTFLAPPSPFLSPTPSLRSPPTPQQCINMLKFLVYSCSEKLLEDPFIVFNKLTIYEIKYASSSPIGCGGWGVPPWSMLRMCQCGQTSHLPVTLQSHVNIIIIIIGNTIIVINAHHH